MKIGVCSKPNHWKDIKKFGYDYAEGQFLAVATYSDAEFEEMRRLQKEAALSIEAFNKFFDANVELYGGKETDAAIESYADKGFYRAKQLGGEIAVLGSGAARSIPVGMEKARAQERFAHVLRLLGDTAKKNGMLLTVEPLRAQETNFINTLEEGVKICKLAAHKNVGLTLDFFHFFCNGEPIESIFEAKDHLYHAHLARPNTDRKPPSAEDIPACRLWADALNHIGYRGRISLEAAFAEDPREEYRHANAIMQMFRA